MSFVSIIARENFISVMSDGRVMYGNEIIQEDYQKFIKINDQSFVAFAGSKEICEIFIEEVRTIVNQNSNIINYLHSLVGRFNQLSLNNHGLKVMLGIGGINSNQEIEFHTINSIDNQILNFSPKGEMISYAFLNNTKYDDSVLVNKLIETLGQTGFGVVKEVKKAQKILNDFVAATDQTVNDTTYHVGIEK